MNEPRVVESVTNECQSLGRAHESSSARAEQLIACLECEIAKRDAELAACRVAVENCELFRARIAELEALSVTKVMLDIVPGDGDGYEVYAKSVSDVETKLGELGEENEELQFEREQLRAELAAIKAQEPVGYVVEKRTGSLTALSGVIRASAILEDFVTDGTPLYAAPVSEAKAHGNYAPASVVWIDAHHVIEGNNPSFIKDVALVSAERTSETQIPLARLNATPVQQVSVPDGWRLVKVGIEGVQFGNAWFSHEGITGYTADQLNSDNCRITGRAYMDWLAAAPAAPAADAGLVEALGYQVLFDAIAAATSVYANGAVNISVQAFRDAIAAHRAQGVV